MENETWTNPDFEFKKGDSISLYDEGGKLVAENKSYNPETDLCFGI